MQKKKIIYISVLIICLILLIIIYDFYINDNDERSNKDMNEIEENNIDEIKGLEVTIDNKTYSIALEDNETVKELLKIMPLNLEMNDLNENEKYIYIDETLKTSNSYTGQITKGDIMLYGDNCLVIFYKDFITTYNYTKIGHIEGLDDLNSDSIIAEFKTI